MPPVIPLPEAFDIPFPKLAQPSFEMPKWEPIPIKKEDIPALKPKPKEKSDEPEKEELENKPMDLGETLDAMQQLMTPTPPLPPYDYGQELVEESQVETVELFGKFEVPVPKQEIMVTAVSTAGAAAVASVGATMVAGKVFNQVFKIAKPVIKTVLNKLAKLRGKPPAPTWARQRLESRRRTGDKTYSKGGS